MILGLFSGAGGRMILYRPGMAPIDAPQVPIVYQLMKSVGHSTMALAEVVVPYIDDPDDKSWRGSMLAYRSRMQSALDGLDADADGAGLARQQPHHPAEQHRLHGRLRCQGRHYLRRARSFRQETGALSGEERRLGSANAGRTLDDVLAGWKAQLGADWDKTYAASNTIYVARQNNVLFSVLAQFFGPDAINGRLMLIETISFTTTPDDMLESLTRIIADRSVGALFFGNYHLMDFELMGGERARDRRRNRQARHDAVPAARRSLRLEAVADIDHAGAGAWPIRDR